MTPDPVLEEIKMKTPVTKGEIHEEYQQADSGNKESWTDKVGTDML